MHRSYHFKSCTEYNSIMKLRIKAFGIILFPLIITVICIYKNVMKLVFENDIATKTLPEIMKLLYMKSSLSFVLK